MRLAVITLGGLFFVSCSGDSSNNATAPSTADSVCVEGTTTTINGESYVCRNDSFVSVNSNSSQGQSQVCIAGSTMQDALGISYSCQNNDWVMIQGSSNNGSNNTNRSSSSSVHSVPVSSSSSGYSITITLRSSSSLAVNHDGYKGTLKDSRDGKTYKTIGIGENIWMAENLNYKTDSSWCYNNLEEKCDYAGRLYKWTDVVKLPPSYIDSIVDISGKYQGICPSGWHIPAPSDFSNMVEHVIKPQAVYDETRAGVVFSSTTGWKRDQGIDSVGFNVKPTGYRTETGSFISDSSYASFWTTNGNGYYYVTYPTYYFTGFPIGTTPMKYYARSLRCVKD